MDNQTVQPAATGGLLPILFALGGVFLFLAVVAIVWLDRQPAPVATGGRPAEERVQLLREHRERERETVERYGWIDRDAGIVRLPVERAMELWLEEKNQGQAQN